MSRYDASYNPPKSPGLAAVLSFFFTGLGQIYCGRIGRGLIMMFLIPFVYCIAAFGVFALFIAGAVESHQAGNEAAAQAAAGGAVGIYVLFGLIGFAYWIYNIYDAYEIASDSNRRSGRGRRERGGRRRRSRPRHRADEGYDVVEDGVYEAPQKTTRRAHAGKAAKKGTRRRLRR